MFKSRFIKISLVIISAGAFTACGSGKKSASASASASSTDTNAPLTAAQLAGTWKAGCAIDTINGGSSQDLLIITGNTYISRTEFSNATDCSNPDLALDINGTFTMGGKSTLVAVATNLTMSSINGALTPKTAASVLDLITTVACGLASWQLNAKQIVPLTCFGLTPVANSADIVAISGNTLMFGDTAGSALDPNYSFQKQ